MTTPTAPTAPTAKRAVQAALARLPDTASWEEIMYALYVVETVQGGLDQADVGQTLSHADASARFDALRTQ